MSLTRDLCLGVSVWGSLSRESFSRGLCPGEGISVQGSMSWGGSHCPWGLWQFLSRRVFIRVSLSRGLYLGGLSGGLCPGGLCMGSMSRVGGSLSRVYVKGRGSLSMGSLFEALCPGEG